MAAINSPNATVRGLHVNTLLSQFSVGYHPQGFIADQVFPIIKVAKESDDFLRWDKGQAFRVGRTDGKESMRADGTEAAQDNYGGTYDSYLAEEYAWKTRITDRERENADDAYNLETSKVRRVMNKLLLDYEYRVANIATSTSTYASSNYVTLSGTSQWNNASFSSKTGNVQSVIKQNVEAGRNAIRTATGGYMPTHIIVPYPVAQVVANDVGVADLIKYTQSDLLVAGMLPQQLWGMQVLIPQAMGNSAVEGEVPSLGDVWGKNVVLFYRSPTMTLDDLTFGLTMQSRASQVKTYREEKVESTFYEASFVQAEKLIAADCGYLIQNVIA